MSCGLLYPSCLTWAKPSAGTRKNCPQVLRLRCDLKRGRGKWKKQQSGQSDRQRERRRRIIYFSDFSLQSPAEHNIWHRKHLARSWVGFLLYTHNIQAAPFLSFPVFCLLFPPMCSHVTVPIRSVGHVYTAFMAVLICRTSHREDGTQPALILIRLRK